MKPEVVEGARNLRLILTSDTRPAILAGLNLSQEELMLRLCNDVMDADLEVKGLEERLRHSKDDSLALSVANELIVSQQDALAQVGTALAREKEIGAELSKEVAQLRANVFVVVPQPPQAFTPLATALQKAKPKKKAKR